MDEEEAAEAMQAMEEGEEAKHRPGWAQEEGLTLQAGLMAKGPLTSHSEVQVHHDSLIL